ncbi:calmin isoform X3 [Dendrobates tinctorius]
MSSSSSLSSLPSGTESDTSHPSTSSTEKSMSVSIRDQRRAIKALLNWVQQRTRKYGVAVQDFAGSWRSGLAFLAIIKAINSSLVDMKNALDRSPRDNLENAFSIATRSLNIPRLLEPEDVMVDSPDEHSIMTYVTQFLEHFPELDPDDFSSVNEDAPLEMTYVRYKDGPMEEESKIITVNRAEDNGYTVELHTRPLTPPETHDYAEVNIQYDDKLNFEKDPFQVPDEKTQGQEVTADAARYKLNTVLQRVDMFPTRSDVIVKSPVGADIKINNDEGDCGGLQGPVDTFTIFNGKNARHHTDSEDDVQPNSSSSLGDTINSESSSSFSSISDKEPNDIFYQTEVDHSQLNPRLTSEVMSFPKTSEAENTYKYVLHQPKGSLTSDHAKQFTVFQAYKASDNDGHLLSSDCEPQEGDGTFPPKISIIPHDLFYYPHYSVPIADVLQAFADTCPDSLLENTFTYEVSSEEQAGDNETLSSGVYLDTESIGSDTSVEESQEILGVEESVHKVHYAKTSSQETPLANGSVAQANREVSSGGFISYPGGQHSFLDDGTDSSEEEREWLRREGLVCRRKDLEEDDDDFLEEEHRAERQNVETEEFCLSRDIRDDRRGDVNTPGQSNFGTYNNVHEEGRQPLGFGGLDAHEAPIAARQAGNSWLPFSSDQSPECFYPLILLWLLCYFLMILPELDMSKVAFFVDND